MYLMLGTRPDLAFSVSEISKVMENPLREHWEAVKKILRYVKGTSNTSFVIHGNGNLCKIQAYADASYASDQL
jgi:hypothetical protein